MDRPYVHIYSECNKKKFKNILQKDKTWQKFLMVDTEPFMGLQILKMLLFLQVSSDLTCNQTSFKTSMHGALIF